MGVGFACEFAKNCNWLRRIPDAVLLAALLLTAEVSGTMAEIQGQVGPRYQLPEGTYRELIEKPRTMKFLKKRLADERNRYEQRADIHRSSGDADELARVRAAAADDVAAGKPIVVLAWQVLVSRHAYRLAAVPSWLTASATATVRVFADDTCEPASF